MLSHQHNIDTKWESTVGGNFGTLILAFNILPNIGDKNGQSGHLNYLGPLRFSVIRQQHLSPKSVTNIYLIIGFY